MKIEITKILKKYEKKADTILLCLDYKDILYVLKKYTKKTTEEIINMGIGSLSISEICIFFGIKIQLTICKQYILKIN